MIGLPKASGRREESSRPDVSILREAAISATRILIEMVLLVVVAIASSEL